MASAKLQGTIFAPEDPVRLDTFVEVVDMRPSYSIIALNAPIGNLEPGDVREVGRATARLGPSSVAGAASIKSAPVGIDSGVDVELLPDHLDAISRTLLPRYREVAAEMAPYRQRTIYEVHSDLSFYQLNGDMPLQWSKHSEKGRQERRTLLEERVPGVTRILDAEVPGATPSHLLDAAAFLWTARRIFAHAAIRIPEDPEWDEQGLRMEMFR